MYRSRMFYYRAYGINFYGIYLKWPDVYVIILMPNAVNAMTALNGTNESPGGCDSGGFYFYF
jgi:hypothetical protein